MPPRPPSYRPGVKRAPARTVTPAARKSSSYEKNRPSSTARGYDRTWSRLRVTHLNANPYCKRCEDRAGRYVAASIVDHIIRVEERPDLRLDPANLQSLCVPCHSGPKQREDNRRRRRLEREAAENGTDTARGRFDPEG